VTNYEVSQLSAITTGSIVAGVLLLVVDPNDTSTPPAGPGGSDKKMTLAQLAAYLTSPATGAVVPAVTSLTDGSSVPLNAALGNDFRWTLGGSSHTLAAPSNPKNGQPITIAVKYGGSYTPLFNSVFDFGAGGQPSWTATSGRTDYVGFRFDSALNGGAGEWAYQGAVLGLAS